MGQIVLHPILLNSDEETVFRGRMAALAQYQAARSDTQRLAALRLYNFWRVKAQMGDHARMVRGAVP